MSVPAPTGAPASADPPFFSRENRPYIVAALVAIAILGAALSISGLSLPAGITLVAAALLLLPPLLLSTASSPTPSLPRPAPQQPTHPHPLFPAPPLNSQLTRIPSSPPRPPEDWRASLAPLEQLENLPQGSDGILRLQANLDQIITILTPFMQDRYAYANLSLTRTLHKIYLLLIRIIQASEPDAIADYETQIQNILLMIPLQLYATHETLKKLRELLQNENKEADTIMTLLRTIQDTALDTCFAGPSGILQPALRPILFLQFCLEAYLVNPDPSQVPSFFERYNAALPTVKDLHQRLLATWSAEAPGSA